MLRKLLCAAFIFAAVTPAHAQDKPAATAAAPIEAPSEEALAAGQNLYRSIIFDSGALDAIFEAFTTHMLPDIQVMVERSPLYQEASPTGRDAIVAFVQGMPDLLQREFNSEFDEMSGRAAPRLAALMTIEELNQIADFMRTPEMRARWRDLVETAVVPDKVDAGTFPEWRNTPFADTAGGRALAQHEDAIDEILVEEFETSLVLFEPRMRALLVEGMCNALGDDCPAYIRDSVGRT